MGSSHHLPELWPPTHQQNLQTDYESYRIHDIAARGRTTTGADVTRPESSSTGLLEEIYARDANNASHDDLDNDSERDFQRKTNAPARPSGFDSYHVYPLQNQAARNAASHSREPTVRRSSDAGQAQTSARPLQSTMSSETTLTGISYRRSLWLPLLATITVPLIVPIALALVIEVYRVPFQKNRFSVQRPNFANVLVNLEDTRIMLVISGLNVIIPPLANYIVGLYTPRVVQELTADVKQHYLPSPYEIALIGGVCQASMWQFLKTPWYQWKSRRSTKALQFATMVYSRLLVLWLMTLGAIVLLHVTTRMVEHDSLDFDAKYNPGRGLTEQCLSYDRSETGLPCTDNSSAPDRAYQLREEFRLARGTSSFSKIEHARVVGRPSKLGLLLANDVPTSVDYLASTFGTCIDCEFITDQCRLHAATTDIASEAYFWTAFNCSPGFYGMLGKEPVIVDFYPAPDADTPHLNFKPSLHLQIGYYFDPGLEFPYNPVGYDALLNRTLDPYSAAELMNPLYMAVAGRVGFTGLGRAFAHNTHREIWSDQGNFLEFVLRCKVTTYDVAYAVVKNTVSDLTLTESNGTIFELFHGKQLYDTISANTILYLEMLAQAGLQNSTASLAHKWEQLFTTKVLSVIGSVTTSRAADVQQERNPILVAEMKWYALALLYACPICYALAGVKIILLTRKLGHGKHLLGAVMSTPGVGFTATAAPALMLQALGQKKASVPLSKIGGSSISGGVSASACSRASRHRGWDQVTVVRVEGMQQLKILESFDGRNGQDQRQEFQRAPVPNTGEV